MSTLPADSVGLVTPQRHTFSDPLPLACGKALASYELVYETYGQLNAGADNAVLICHALSGHHHAAGYHSIDERTAPPGHPVSIPRPAKLTVPASRC